MGEVECALHAKPSYNDRLRQFSTLSYRKWNGPLSSSANYARFYQARCYHPAKIKRYTLSVRAVRKDYSMKGVLNTHAFIYGVDWVPTAAGTYR